MSYELRSAVRSAFRSGGSRLRQSNAADSSRSAFTSLLISIFSLVTSVSTFYVTRLQSSAIDVSAANDMAILRTEDNYLAIANDARVHQQL